MPCQFPSVDLMGLYDHQLPKPCFSTPKNDKSKDYCKADLNNEYCFFIIVFRLAIPASLGLQMLNNVNLKVDMLL